ncbi:MULTISPECIES: PilC/PilY family type IV pilus protein [unclassified Acinetobacter]|uniref:PilC/PilY family type IV pilus protein n=1 Tax=unclassified Acinetobacter TaxID=196816 RepID=UPI00211E665F|nr:MULTISPECIES: PilC/PilY family type IV pilus protein [unclassified Acinetobacter]
MMKKQTYKLAVVSGLKNMNLRPLAVACMSFMGTCVLTASVAQASDLQIYATPEAGQKTIVMMLDTSGSMGDSDSGQTGSRLYRLKQGMYKLLESNDGNLTNTKVGLGRFWGSSSRDGGYILVEAAKMGPVGSAHRQKLRTAVDGLKAEDWTPTAQAYVEAAAYLMGTNSLMRASIRVDAYLTLTQNEKTQDARCPDATPYYRSYNNLCYENRIWSRGQYWYSGATAALIPAKYEDITRHYQCTALSSTNFADERQYCNSSGWKEVSLIPEEYITRGGTAITNGTLYTFEEIQTQPNNYSGFTRATKGAIRDDINYISPLPEESKRQSCDGQGVYILSDGEANRSGKSIVEPMMQAALDNKTFSCPSSGGLISSGDSAWHCMGEFAKYLFDKTKNPAGVSIQTAFVGFGSDFNGLSKPHVQQACKISSRTQDDRRSNDACSPTADTVHRLTKPGYGNGGYFETQATKGVTDSVIQFIKNLGDTKIEPLPTGAISVPVDALNPNGFQPYGYLRALSPNPGQPVSVWAGNLKKYNIVNGALADGATTVFTELGKFDLTTRDIWNNTGVADGGLVDQGGVYWNLPMPTQEVEAITANPLTNTRAVPKIQANPNAIRNLFTDAASVSAGQLTAATQGVLLEIPAKSGATTVSGAYILDKFNNQAVLKDFPLLLKYKLLNYLGYNLDLTTPTSLPTQLNVPTQPFISLGGSIHSFPVQLTYSGELDVNGDLTSVRQQSVLYGSMEGGLHVVDARTGIEQTVFVPSEILNNPDASRALRFGEAGTVQHGISGAWIADPAYKTERGTGTGSSVVTARKMNVYGGMRMGGKSYYGMDLMNPRKPELLFRIGADQSNFSRMGQTWSKPVLANIRYQDKIRRVLIVGGGYDQCYEYPRFSLGSTNPAEFGGGCSKTAAEGNAVYIVDAQTGERLWWTSNAGSNLNNANLVHSIPSRISTLDRDADGLVDHLYFGDLGGQVFRIDLNNAKGTPTSSFGKNVIRLANLATSNTGAAVASGDAPRFYQPPTITIHDEGSDTFIVVGIASGDRSTPLDVAPSRGRESLKPFDPIQNRPTNKVYGLIDRDFIEPELIRGNYTSFKSQNITLDQLQPNPQNLNASLIRNTFLGTGSGVKQGWYRSLSSNYLGSEVAGRTPGGVKAFEEEPIAIKGNLFIPVYDPEGTGVEDADPCQPRIVGESNRQQYCLPFGVCLKNGLKDTDSEKRTGMIIEDGKNKNVLGAGIRGITLGPVGGGSGSGSGGPNTNSCGTLTLIGNLQGAGEWECLRVLNPVRWYEKNVAP